MRYAMVPITKLGFFDRLVCAFFGAAFGLPYGGLLALLALALTRGEFSVAYIVATVIVFAVLGFLIGPFIGDVVAAVLHFIVGLFTGAVGVEGIAADLEPRESGLMNSLFWFGVGTGFVALFIAIYGKA